MAVPGPVVDRLRSNLRAAGIPFSEPDIEGILERRFLEGLLAFERTREARSDPEAPDYLRGSEAAVEAIPADGPGAAVRDSQPGPVSQESLVEAAARVRAGEVSPVELTERALARIAERDPILNAFQLLLAEPALEAARQAEREIASGGYRGPLHGIPIAVKDLLDLQGTVTTAGSRILSDNVASSSATAVERLLAAGAIVVGKTRLSEFAYAPGSINAHYGSTRNPQDPGRDTGGSSSGSAAAVADGMVYGAIGSDTGGSIRIPAALCGIVGLKPSFGRISLHGVAPLSWSLDHLGPMARSVADAAAMLDVLAGPDPRDPRSRSPARPAVPRDPDEGVRGLRIGVPEELPSSPSLAGEEAWAAARRGLAALEREGAELVPLRLPELEELWLANSVVLAVEAAAFHEPWLRTRSADYGEFPRLRLMASYAHGPSSFVHAQQARARLRERLRAVLGGVDLLGTPTQPEGAPPLGQPGWTRPTAPWNALGWPALTVPVGRTVAGLPLGLQLIGGEGDEATVLRAGRAVELARTP